MTIAVSLMTRAGTAFAAYREGDTGRLAGMVDLLSPILWRAARAQHVCAADAEEIVQVAWLRLLDHADDIVEPAAVLTWLIVTVKREAWRRSGRATHEVSTDLHDAVMPETTPGPNTKPCSPSGSVCSGTMCSVSRPPAATFVRDRLRRTPGLRLRRPRPGPARRQHRPRRAAAAWQTAQCLATDPEWCAEP